MRFDKLSKVFKRYRIQNFQQKLVKNPNYFISQLTECTTCIRKDMKEICYYPGLLKSLTDINTTRLLLILSSDNYFLCNSESKTENKKVIEYQQKHSNIGDHFFRECYSRCTELEIQANDAYVEINSLLAAAKSANSKRFRISPFFNFWHCSLTKENWQLYECKLETDDFVTVNYKLPKKKHKNYCFNPSLLFGATKEDIYIGLNADEDYYYCYLKIGLLIDSAVKKVATSFASVAS